MQVTWDGEDYLLDLDDMDTTEARYIKKKTGYNPVELQEAMFGIDADAMSAIYWLMLKQSGKPMVNFENVNIKLVKFAEAVVAAYKVENGLTDDEADEAEGDPKDQTE